MVDRNERAVVICGGVDGSICAWQASDSKKVFTWDAAKGRGPVTHLVAREIGSRYLTIAVWNGHDMRALNMETGDLLAEWHWAGSANREINAISIIGTESGDSFLAVAADCDLFLLELPSLQVHAEKQDASAAAIYSIAPWQHDGRDAVLTGSDSYSGGRVVEHEQLRVWSVSDLSLLATGGTDRNLIRKMWRLSGEGTRFAITDEMFGRICVRAGDDLRLLAATEDISIIYTVYRDEGRLLVLCSRKRDALMEIDDQPLSHGSGIKLTEWPIRAELVGGAWTDVVTDNGRPVTFSRDNNRVRAWDLRTLLNPGPVLSPGVRDFRELVLLAVDYGAGFVFTGAAAGEVSAWNNHGEPVWSLRFDKEIRGIHYVSMGTDEVLVVGFRDACVLSLDPRTGRNRTHLHKLGVELHQLAVHQIRGRPVLFAAVNLGSFEGRDLYVARAIDVMSNVEEVTWLAVDGIEAAYEDHDVPGFAKALNGGVPMLTLNGYYKTKILYAVTHCRFDEVNVAALAGPHGEVQAFNYDTLEKLTVWRPGRAGQYILVLASATIDDGSAFIFGGDDAGLLFRVTLPRTLENARSIESAHRGEINTLITRRLSKGWVVVSGGDDGRVRFWTEDLEPLGHIDAERPVIALAAGDQQLIIGTDRGVMTLEIDWNRLFLEHNHDGRVQAQY